MPFNLSSLKAIKPAASITFAAAIQLEHAISLKGTKINEAINVNMGVSGLETTQFVEKQEFPKAV